MAYDSSLRAKGSLPPISLATLVVMIVSGAVATVAFDLFGQSLSPAAGFSGLAPVSLAKQTLKVLFGINSNPGGHFLHFVVAGTIGYPLGWMFIARPVIEKVLPGLGWFPASVLYGIGLWVFAIGFMASFVAGNPFFLNFTGITWVALVGHVLYAVVCALVVDWLERAGLG
ncbi:MAG: hypothetical protein ACRBCJ_14745 [Hyphomicrobiaceae bacterium]